MPVPQLQEVQHPPHPQSRQISPSSADQYRGGPARTTPPEQSSESLLDRRQTIDGSMHRGRAIEQSQPQPAPELRSRSQSRSRPSTQSSSENIPRPDIALPPRESAPSIRSTGTSNQRRQPHYLPKKLVMPAPLQPQIQARVPSNDPSMNMPGAYGSADYSGTQIGDDPLSAKKVRFHREARLAEDIPISQGPNVLRKRSMNMGRAYNAAAYDAPLAPVPAAPPARQTSQSVPSMSRRLSMLVENVPANKSNTVFSARVDVMHRAPTVSGQQFPQQQQQPPPQRPSLAPTQIPRDLTKEREIERTLSMAGVSAPPFDVKEKKGKKLSKKR